MNCDRIKYQIIGFTYGKAQGVARRDAGAIPRIGNTTQFFDAAE